MENNNTKNIISNDQNNIINDNNSQICAKKPRKPRGSLFGAEITDQNNNIYWDIKKCLEYLNVSQSYFYRLRKSKDIKEYEAGNKIYFLQSDIKLLKNPKIVAIFSAIIK